ncbi:uncharacterized protein LOC135498826 [Lineus longissimus]|uniref:uncharacterized protein LOC135498826 n=1 Tax=Lineus longissimus TaxID=88925 RepID=UPI00315CD8B6
MDRQDLSEDAAQQLQLVTDVVQRHAKLQHTIRTKNSATDDNKLYKDVAKANDQLRSIKSQIEGSHVGYEMNQFNEDLLPELHRMAQLTVPSYLEDHRSNIFSHIQNCFKVSPAKILFCGLHTCPWYADTQKEIGQKARHNTIIVVYVDPDVKFYSPTHPHVKDEDHITDKGWFIAIELFHFIHNLLKGKSRLCEVVFCPENAVIHSDPDWYELKLLMDGEHLTGLRGFIEQCRGQAVGHVGKKVKEGRMKYKEGATLYDFCQSYRLLHHAHQALNGQPLSLGPVDDESLPAHAKVARQYLRHAFSHQESDGCNSEEKCVSKQELFDHVMVWKKELDDRIKIFKYTGLNTLEPKLGVWMAKTRHGGRIPQHIADIPSEKKETLTDLMRLIGGPLKDMDPSQIVMIAKAGSALYGLATPESDVDYIVVYAEPTEKLSTSCKYLNEAYESRGPEKSFEYGMYEVRLFVEMVLKGSVVILELLFAENLEYTSPMWEKLVEDRKAFLTEHAILQYLGLIKNNIKTIKSEKFRDQPREKKLYYQIFHKLYCLQYFLRGDVPFVRPGGDDRDFIMNIRRGPLESDISSAKLLEIVEERVDKFYVDMYERKTRLPEFMNYIAMTNWLLEVRGLR